MRVLELYSGIGGMHYALKESSVPGEVVAAVDINTVANEVYSYNFPKVNCMNRNIESLSEKLLKNLNVDTILMSPPCQPFTRLGLQKDSQDSRSCSFFHVLSIIPKLDSLEQILVENVVGFENSETRNALVDCLQKCDFNYKEFILSPHQFGVPNTRHRYYMLAKRKNRHFCFAHSTLEHSFPEEMKEILPTNLHMQLAIADDTSISKKTHKLNRIIDKDIDDEEFALPEKLLFKRFSVLDIRTPESQNSCCFTKAYGRYVEGTGSILSLLNQRVFEEKILEIEKLGKNQQDIERLLIELKLRYFAPSEVSRLMCFPSTFKFPDSITRRQKYRLLGNSINVHVVSRLIYLLNYEGPSKTVTQQ